MLIMIECILNISSIAEKTVLAKDNSGDPTNFKSTITVNFEILNEIKSNSEIRKILKDQKIQKTIFVPNRLINIII